MAMIYKSKEKKHWLVINSIRTVNSADKRYLHLLFYKKDINQFIFTNVIKHHSNCSHLGSHYSYCLLPQNTACLDLMMDKTFPWFLCGQVVNP